MDLKTKYQAFSIYKEKGIDYLLNNQSANNVFILSILVSESMMPYEDMLKVAKNNVSKKIALTIKDKSKILSFLFLLNKDMFTEIVSNDIEYMYNNADSILKSINSSNDVSLLILKDRVSVIKDVRDKIMLGNYSDVDTKELNIMFDGEWNNQWEAITKNLNIAIKVLGENFVKYYLGEEMLKDIK